MTILLHYLPCTLAQLLFSGSLLSSCVVFVGNSLSPLFWLLTSYISVTVFPSLAASGWLTRPPAHTVTHSDNCSYLLPRQRPYTSPRHYSTHRLTHKAQRQQHAHRKDHEYTREHKFPYQMKSERTAGEGCLDLDVTGSLWSRAWILGSLWRLHIGRNKH